MLLAANRPATSSALILLLLAIHLKALTILQDANYLVENEEGNGKAKEDVQDQVVTKSKRRHDFAKASRQYFQSNEVLRETSYVTEPPKIPAFMMQLYREYARRDRSTEGSDGLGNKIIRCYFDEGHLTQLPRNETSKLLRFDVSNIDQSEVVASAELLIALKFPDCCPANKEEKLWKVDIIRLGREVTRENREAIDDVIAEGELLTSKITPAINSTTWHSFDMTSCVDRWRSRPVDNFGLLIRGTMISGQNPTNRPIFADHLGNGRKYRPFLVTYGAGITQEKLNSRLRRAPTKRRNEVGGRQGLSPKLNAGVPPRTYAGQPLCKRRSMQVLFSDLNWGDWVIAPPSFNAYRCEGTCPNPIPEHLNGTNHAIVQSMWNSIKPDSVPKPCCVPTVLKSLPILYSENKKNDSLILKELDEMVVTACGCR